LRRLTGHFFWVFEDFGRPKSNVVCGISAGERQKFRTFGERAGMELGAFSISLEHDGAGQLRRGGP
jgi:hypothetical protein